MSLGLRMNQHEMGVKQDFIAVHASRDADLGSLLAGDMQVSLSKVPQEALSGSCERVTVMGKPGLKRNTWVQPACVRMRREDKGPLPFPTYTRWTRVVGVLWR